MIISLHVHLVGPWMPRYVGQYYSGCFCEGMSGSAFKQWTLRKADCPPRCRWAPSNQLKV